MKQQKDDCRCIQFSNLNDLRFFWRLNFTLCVPMVVAAFVEAYFIVFCNKNNIIFGYKLFNTKLSIVGELAILWFAIKSAYLSRRVLVCAKIDGVKCEFILANGTSILISVDELYGAKLLRAIPSKLYPLRGVKLSVLTLGSERVVLSKEWLDKLIAACRAGSSQLGSPGALNS